MNEMQTFRDGFIGYFSPYLESTGTPSKLLTWSVNMTPSIAKPLGSATSKGYPFCWRVIGHTTANPLTSLNDFG